MSDRKYFAAVQLRKSLHGQRTFLIRQEILASESPENDRSLDSRATGPQNSSTSTREYKQLYRSLLGFGASRPLFLRVVSLVRNGQVSPKPRRAVSNFQIPVFHTISGQRTFEVLLYISIIGPWTKDGRGMQERVPDIRFVSA